MMCVSIYLAIDKIDFFIAKSIYTFLIYLIDIAMDYVKLMSLPKELIDYVMQFSTFEPGSDLDVIVTVVKSINKHSVPAGLNGITYSDYFTLSDSVKIPILQRLVDYFNYRSPFITSRLSFTSDEPLAAYMELHRVNERMKYRTLMVQKIKMEIEMYNYMSVMFEQN